MNNQQPKDKQRSSFPQNKEEFEAYKKALEAKGFGVITKWRKGLKSIRLTPIVLSEGKSDE